MQAPNPKYLPSYRFVDGSSSKYGRSDQSHAQRESARMRQWERRKDLIGSMPTVGEFAWTRRSTRPPAKENPEAKEEGDPAAENDPCAAHRKGLRPQTGAARRNPVIKRFGSASGSSIVKLRPRCTAPFETFVKPIEGKCLDVLLDFRKSHRSACSDRF
jgi:hypothetical protein